MKGLFDGKIQYRNTKEQGLINSGIIMQSAEIQNYFKENIDGLLNIKQWIIDEKQQRTNNKQTFRGIGDIILNKLTNKLKEIIAINEEMIDIKRNSYLVENNSYNDKYVQKYEGNLNSNSNYSGVHGVRYSASGIDVSFDTIIETINV